MVAVVGCGKSKVNYMTNAYKLYTGSYFLACFRYAFHVTRDPMKIFILSAKYGFISCMKPIEPYDLFIGDKGSVSVAIVRKQITDCGISDDKCIAVCGKSYHSILERCFKDIENPILGLNMFDAMKHLKQLSGKIQTAQHGR